MKKKDEFLGKMWFRLSLKGNFSKKNLKRPTLIFGFATGLSAQSTFCYEQRADCC